MKELNDFEFDQVQRIVIRLILKITFDKKSRERVYRLWDNRERRVDDLISHKEKFDKGKFILFKVFGKYLIEKLEKLFGIKLTMDNYWHWFGVIAINNMEVGNRMCYTVFFRLHLYAKLCQI